MRSFYLLTITIAFSAMLMQGSFAEGFYKWKDARGHIQYGDKPPQNVKIERFKMPDITVIEGFKDQWQPLNDDVATKNISPKPIKTKVAVKPRKKIIYTKFAFIAPKNGQIMKPSFKGSVSAMLSIKPPLKKGHQIVFSLDGNQVSKSKARTNNFSNLKRGEHTVTASIVDRNGEVLANSENISFTVMRN